MKKTEILMNKLDYLEISVLELDKILMYEFWVMKKQSCVI